MCETKDWLVHVKMYSTFLAFISIIFKITVLISIAFCHQVSAFVKDTNEQSTFNVTELDCRMRILASQYARHIQSFRQHDDIVFRQVDDALQMQDLCPEYISLTKHVPFTKNSKNTPMEQSTAESTKQHPIPTTDCTVPICIYIDSTIRKARRFVSASPENAKFEVPNIANALLISRKMKAPYDTKIIFRSGIHYVGVHSNPSTGKPQPIELQLEDSGLTISGEADAWISGAIPLPNDDDITWSATAAVPGKMQCQDAILVANLTDIFHRFQITNIPSFPSLFGPQNRYIRARYPNANPEIDQWGYNSPQRLVYSIAPEEVLEWHKPKPTGSIPTFTYVDLRSNDDNPNRPIKNDSTMEMYNVYSAGVGGVCSLLWGDEPSYWCSNSSAGGWAEVDQDAAVSGRLNIPTGMTYNPSTAAGQRITRWNHSAEGGIIHAWHSQSWAMHMFKINSSQLGQLFFDEGGGRQGGRNWCRCDQCSYAAPWCGQRQSPKNNSDTRLISGTWAIENILWELDMPGEFYFDHATKLLYVYPNRTNDDSSEDRTTNDLSGLRLSVLDQLIRLTKGVSNVTISNIGFRDTSATYMSDWSVPSGGDWSIHRGGAVFIEDAKNILIENCEFSRLDGNAIFLSRRTRNVSILRSTFEWIGESAIALWGETDGFNATHQTFPMYTIIEGNVMREVGIFQKQSSGVFISKAAFTTIQYNLMFNIARAAINFNDMVGGGDIVTWNLLFNTCRESGDHGPINSWDRQPFLTTLLDGTTPSFNPIRRRISYNLIIANYGASQAVDNDDGSSWYHIFHNVMYWSNGFKMDYGGHDSIFEDNIVIGFPRKSMCVGFGTFYKGHGHVVRRNFCFAANDNEAIVQLETCKDNHAVLYENQYFTPNGNATCQCGYDALPIPFDKCKEQFGIENRSTVSSTPNDAKIVVNLAMTVLFPDFDIETVVAYE